MSPDVSGQLPRDSGCELFSRPRYEMEDIMNSIHDVALYATGSRSNLTRTRHRDHYSPSLSSSTRGWSRQSAPASMRRAPLISNMASCGIDINGQQEADGVRNMPRAGPGEFRAAHSSDRSAMRTSPSSGRSQRNDHADHHPPDLRAGGCR